MKSVFIAIGLLFFIEGILYAIFPVAMKKMLNNLKDMSEQKLRSGGLFFALTGFIIIYYIKKFY
jgi:uncharacterized protein YjeT (DUF2065 family)